MEHGYIIDGNPAQGGGAPERVTIESREPDGFIFARTSTGTLLRLTRSEIYPSAYAAGRHAGRSRNHPWRDVADFADAAQSWKSAQNEHAHTSFYGAQVVREYRAYWLGRLRTARETVRLNNVTSMRGDGTTFHHMPL